MKAGQPTCEHTCHRTCELMNELLQMEEQLSVFYGRLKDACDYPDIKRFLEELAVQHGQTSNLIEKRINELYASFDPAGC